MKRLVIFAASLLTAFLVFGCRFETNKESKIPTAPSPLNEQSMILLMDHHATTVLYLTGEMAGNVVTRYWEEGQIKEYKWKEFEPINLAKKDGWLDDFASQRKAGQMSAGDDRLLFAGNPLLNSNRIRFLGSNTGHQSDKQEVRSSVTREFGDMSIKYKLQATYLSGQAGESSSLQVVISRESGSPESKTFPKLSVVANPGQSSSDQVVIESMQSVLQMVSAPGRPPSPFAHTNRRFNGHVFWDADMWLHPCLTFLAPKYARDIPKYRLDRLSAAEENYVKWLAEKKPIGVPGNPQGKNFMNQPLKSEAPFAPPAKYPWESKFDGSEGSPSETVFEEHIGGDVAFMLNRAIAFGQVDQERAEQAIKQIASYYQARLMAKKGNTIGLDGVVSPSEWDIVDDDLYTNAIAAWTMNRASRHFRVKPFLPRDNTTFLTFPGDTLKQYQQHAALLTIYPLQLPEAEREAEAMMKRFQGKAYPKGPAMSLSIEATILARLGRADEALAVWRESWLRYGQPDLYEFAEKPGGESYFMTGAAGCLNSVLYGFMGLRIDDHEPKGKAWTLPLQNGHWLSAEPHLPSEWSEITLENVEILGKNYNLNATQKGFKAVEI